MHWAVSRVIYALHRMVYYCCLRFQLTPAAVCVQVFLSFIHTPFNNHYVIIIAILMQVAKLARIVKHVIPNRSMELDENVDKNTSNWLAQVCISC